MSTSVTVVIADDHLMVRQGLRALLTIAKDIEVIGEAPDGKEAVELAKKLHPDIVVMDFSMPGMNGLQATAEIKRLGLSSKVVMLSMHDDLMLVSHALDQGVSGYVLKNSAFQVLAESIRTVHQGEVYLEPSLRLRLNATSS